MSLAGLFDILFICYGSEVVYERSLYSLFRRHCKRSLEKKGIDWTSLCCFESLYSNFYLVHDVVDGDGSPVLSVGNA